MGKKGKIPDKIFSRILNDLVIYSNNIESSSDASNFRINIETLAELYEMRDFINKIPDGGEIFRKVIEPKVVKEIKEDSNRRIAFGLLCNRLNVPNGVNVAHRWMMLGKRLAEQEPEFQKLKPTKRGRPKKMYFELLEFQLAEFKESIPLLQEMTDKLFCSFIKFALKNPQISDDYRMMFSGTEASLVKRISTGRSYLRAHNYLVDLEFAGAKEIHKEIYADLYDWHKEFLCTLEQIFNAQKIRSQNSHQTS